MKEFHAVIRTFDCSVGSLNLEWITAIVVDTRITLIADESCHGTGFFGKDHENHVELMNEYREVKTRQLQLADAFFAIRSFSTSTYNFHHEPFDQMVNSLKTRDWSSAMFSHIVQLIKDDKEEIWNGRKRTNTARLSSRRRTSSNRPDHIGNNTRRKKKETYVDPIHAC